MKNIIFQTMDGTYWQPFPHIKPASADQCTHIRRTAMFINSVYIIIKPIFLSWHLNEIFWNMHRSKSNKWRTDWNSSRDRRCKDRKWNSRWCWIRNIRWPQFQYQSCFARCGWTTWNSSFCNGNGTGNPSNAHGSRRFMPSNMFLITIGQCYNG